MLPCARSSGTDSLNSWEVSTRERSYRLLRMHGLKCQMPCRENGVHMDGVEAERTILNSEQQQVGSSMSSLQLELTWYQHGRKRDIANGSFQRRRLRSGYYAARLRLESAASRTKLKSRS